MAYSLQKIFILNYKGFLNKNGKKIEDE